MKTKLDNYCSGQRLLIIGLLVLGLNWNAPAVSIFQSHLSTPTGGGNGAQLSLGRFYFRVEANQVDFVALIFPYGSLLGGLDPVLSVPGDSLNFTLGLGMSEWFYGSHTIVDHNPFLPTPPWLPSGYDEDGNPLYVDTANIRMADVYAGHFTLPPGFADDLLAGLGRVDMNSSFGGSITVAAVPEPTVLSLALLAGLGGLGYSRFQRRSDRLAKYNQLLRIEQLLGKNAVYAGLTALKKSK